MADRLSRQPLLYLGIGLGSRTHSFGQLIGKVVVGIAVMGLVRAHHKDHVAQARGGWQVPVFYRDLRCCHVFDPACVNLCQIVGIADHRLFLEVANHAMRRLGGKQVEKEVEVIKSAAPP
jgi:hypothetical protein